MATLIFLSIIAGAIYVLIGLIAAKAPRVEPYAADIKTLAFWVCVISFAGAVLHKVV
jgi:hypothetical protein